MSSGSTPYRDEDASTGEGTWVYEEDRGDRVQRDVYPDHNDHYIETEYRDGSTYREYDDGTVEKTSGK